MDQERERVHADEAAMKLTNEWERILWREAALRALGAVGQGTTGDVAEAMARRAAMAADVLLECYRDRSLPDALPCGAKKVNQGHKYECSKLAGHDGMHAGGDGTNQVTW